MIGTRDAAGVVRRLLVAVFVVAFGAAPLPAQEPAAPAASVASEFVPEIGQEGKDVVWVPTSPALVEMMLDLAGVTARDFVIDLGSGDGRNVIAAARRGAHGLGVEYNPDMVALSRRLAREAGVADRAEFVQGDMYEADISKATVLALFLLPENLERLADKFMALPPGTRIVMNTFTVAGWEADVRDQLTDGCTSWCEALLHIVPAQVAGVWHIGDQRLILGQEFQNVTGILTSSDGVPIPISGSLRASLLTMNINGRTYLARVEGNRMTGTITDPDGSSSAWSASR